MSKRHHRKNQDKRFKKQKIHTVESDSYAVRHQGTPQFSLLEIANWELVNDCRDIVEYACGGDEQLIRQVVELLGKREIPAIPKINRRK